MLVIYWGCASWNNPDKEISEAGLDKGQKLNCDAIAKEILDCLPASSVGRMAIQR